MKKILLSLISFLLLFQGFVFAEDITSTNYKITGATLNSGGETSTSSSTDFKLFDTIGDFSGDPRVYSANYKSSIGEVEIFTANVPKVACFETTTDGSSGCTTGPSYLNTGGMARVCGIGGCYDRARLEIDTQNNPSDTLYAIQISTDNFVSDVKFIDGVTFKPKTSGTRTIDDYLTKQQWETNSANIRGLESDTQYWVKVTALHGDFTETSPSPTITATTAHPTISFDIDIADTGGSSTETSPPYGISFEDTTKIIQAGPARTASDLIWLDAQTNGWGGFVLLIGGKYGGLYSEDESYTLNSTTGDLDGLTEGYGAQNYYTAQLYENGGGNGELSTISPYSMYGQSGNTVGAIEMNFTKMYESTGPVYSGRMGALLKARASYSTPAAEDYTETITFVIVPRY